MMSGHVFPSSSAWTRTNIKKCSPWLASADVWPLPQLVWDAEVSILMSWVGVQGLSHPPWSVKNTPLGRCLFSH